MSAPSSFTTTLADEQATSHLMADLGLLVVPGDVITLSGDLGAGKSVAARAFIRYVAGDDALEVPSPTFTLVQRYDLAAFAVLHADLYRLSGAGDLLELDLLPAPAGAVLLVEWPDRAGDALPIHRIDIALAINPDGAGRVATVTGHGRSVATVARLKSLRGFLDLSGLAAVPRVRMAGDASSRSYARLVRKSESLILMNSPPRPDGPAVYKGRSYSATVHLAEDVKPFVAIANGLRDRGFSAPKILDADLDDGFLVTEDFGSAGIIEGDQPAPIVERYQRSADMLAKLHAMPLPATLPLPLGRTYTIPDFDIDAMLVEVGLMVEWYLPDRNVTVSQYLREEFDGLWRDLLTNVANAPKTWVLRDFHSPNIIWLPSREGIAQIGIIDFQDAVMGPWSYDVVSLAQDARIDISEASELDLVVRYVKSRRADDAEFDAAAFAASYALMSAQRNTRLLGTFARLNRRDGKPHYLRHQPRAWNYLQRALAHPSLVALREWYGVHLPPPQN